MYKSRKITLYCSASKDFYWAKEYINMSRFRNLLALFQHIYSNNITHVLFFMKTYI